MELIRHGNLGSIDSLALPFHYFYSMQNMPETIVLHDATNLESWVDQTKKAQNLVIQKL